MTMLTAPTGGWKDFYGLTGSIDPQELSQRFDPQSIAALKSGGFLRGGDSHEMTGDSYGQYMDPYQLDIAGAQKAGLMPGYTVPQAISNRGFQAGVNTTFRGVGDPNTDWGHGNYGMHDNSLAYKDPNWGWVTPNQNVYEPSDSRGFLAHLPQIGKMATLAALGYGASYVGAGLLGGGTSGTFLSNLGSTLGKVGVNTLVNGKFNPIGAATSMIPSLPGMSDVQSALNPGNLLRMVRGGG